MKTTRRLSVLAALALIFSIWSPAQGRDRQIQLSEEDGFAMRRFEIVKKAGGKLTGLVHIRSFDSENGRFEVEGVAGDTTGVAVSDIQEIDFDQMVKEKNPVAQEGPWLIDAKVGSAKVYVVAQKLLKIESGVLILPVSVQVKNISAASLNSAGPHTASEYPRQREPRGAKVSVTKQTSEEARRLTYDATKKLFSLEVHEVEYTRKDFSIQGGSSGRKGMQ
jgi:hypothetical protein